MFWGIYQSFIIHKFVMFYGVHTLSAEIKVNRTGLNGNNGTEIECSYTKHNVKSTTSVSFLAFNKSSTKFNEIALYIPNSVSYLTDYGQYLEGRVTLMNITQSMTKAVMTFNKLMCIDDTLYQCKVIHLTSNGVGIINSNNKSISVQVPPSKPDHVSIVHTPVDSSLTSTEYSSLLPSTGVTSTSKETLSTMHIEKQNETTAFNDSTLPETDYHITSSIPSNDDISSDIRYRTTTYSKQQTTTTLGIVEGDTITVVCTGDVGKPPAKHFFQKLLFGQIVPLRDTVTASSTSYISANCSFYRISNLTLQVTAKDNNAVIRCVVNSSMEEPDMFVETAPIKVYSDKSTPSTSGSGDNKAKDNGTLIAIAIAVVLIVIGVVGVLLYRRTRKKENNKSEDKMGSNMNLIESQKITRGVPPTNSTKKTTGYEDVDLDNTDMKCKPVSNEETIAKVKQHNEEYLKKQKEDEDKEKDNPTTPPQAAVYACVNKPKNTVTIENKPSADQQEEDLYEESKEGIYDTSGDMRHKEKITAENFDSTENLKNEDCDHRDLFSEQKSQNGAYINKAFENDSEIKEEKSQVATVSPTVRSSFESKVDGHNNKSKEIQHKKSNQPVKSEDLSGSTEKQSTQETSL